MQIKKSLKTLFSLFIASVTVFAATASVHAWDGDVIWRVKTSRKIVALTFDDGPHVKKTPEILDILAEYGIHATFFTVGKNIKAHPEIIKREIDEGHEIGNHTYSHTFLKKAGRQDVVNELCSFDDEMLEMFEYKSKLFRPPGGLYNETLCQAARDMGYSVVLWSIDTRDWAHTAASNICKNICDGVKGGDIILMHDYIGGSSPTPSVLRVIIPKLLEEGYEFVTVSELLEENISSDAAP